jgi:hypothetical protein
MIMNQPGRLLVTLLSLAVLAAAALALRPAVTASARSPLPQELPPEEALKKARVNGKYRMLLRQIKVPDDFKTYSIFRDYGLRQKSQYAGHTDLPKGYWVYVYPYWYIWRDLTSVSKAARPWSAEQVTGQPNVPQAGDSQMAWCALTADGQEEWLLLEYQNPVVPMAVQVHENFNPGAVHRVTLFTLEGNEVEVWKGKDPTAPNADMGVSYIAFKTAIKTNRVRIYLDSPTVPGWNQIDAVGLIDGAQKAQWPVAAAASSAWAQQPGQRDPNEMEQRLSNLEEEIGELKDALRDAKVSSSRLEQDIRELKEMLKELQKKQK